MRNAFSDALVAAAVADPRVVLLTGDHGYALFDTFRKTCPKQYINCGVAEQNMVGVAAGLAKAGFLPVVYGLAAFVPIRVLEQIKIDVCYEGLPVIFIGDGAGLVYSHLGTSHQSTEDMACTRAIPNLMVLSPADRHEMKSCMELAFSSAGPVYLRVGKSDRGDVHAHSINFAPGELVMVREGRARVSMLATGSMVRTALDLAAPLKDASVWSVPCIKPIEADSLVQIAHGVDLIVTLEEHSTHGGLGSAVSEILSERYPVRIHRIGIQDAFSHLCGDWNYLLHEHKIDPVSIHRDLQSLIPS